MYSGRSDSKKTIGFFGDSFCAHPLKNNWLGKFADHLGAKVVHKGTSGSSYWTTAIDYVDNFERYKRLDYTVFCWTDPHRIYHPSGDITQPKAYEKNDTKHKSARMYFENLQDWKKEKMEFSSCAYWIDNNYLSKVPGKIIHLWSFGDPGTEDWREAELKDIKFLHHWKNGIVIDVPLYYISLRTDKWRQKFDGTLLNDIFHFTRNHMGPDGNEWVFNLLKDVATQEKL